MMDILQVEHPLSGLGSNWKKVISTQRKKAVMACFRMVPLHNLHRHRAINLFLSAYSDLWLSKVEWNQTKLIEDLTVSILWKASWHVIKFVLLLISSFLCIPLITIVTLNE